ncbi:MAG: diguanylate cyclase, partial [Oscillospiraceae bacterium]|nr:diguanylate cyclase [Oscillospiraceae bacterium]
MKIQNRIFLSLAAFGVTVSLLFTVSAAYFMKYAGFYANYLVDALILINIVVLILVILMSIILTRSFAGPLNDFLRILRIITKGNLDERFNYNGKDEFGEIARGFNFLMNSLKQNIDELHEQYDEIKNFSQRYLLVAEYSSAIIFDCSYKTEEIIISENFQKLFGYLPNNKCSIFDRFNVHKDDFSTYERLFSDMKYKPGNHSGEIRIKNAEGIYLWCLIEATTLVDENAAIIRTIGKITDITVQKEQYQDLVYHTQIDLATRLYNKVSGEEMINRVLLQDREDKPLCALLAIDIDNFKDINDKFGHLFGDAVLSECATKLKSVFRTSDIVCRFGGDEFVVFIINPPTEEFVIKRVQEVNNILDYRKVYNDEEYKVSVSIGISFYP